MNRTSPHLKRLFLCALFVTMNACSPTRFFYFPNKVFYRDPEKLGMTYEMVTYPSRNGKILYSILFKTTQDPKGTVVHLHGNYGNVSNHFLQSQFLVKYGYDVLVVDYEGYGGSQGSPNPKKTVEDGIASVQYAYDHARDKNRSIYIFGQSLGAAIGTVVTAKEPLVKAAVLEASFTSYRSMARLVIGKNVILWILYPFYPWMVGQAFDPLRWVDRISPRPILFLHGDKDRIVPLKMSQQLYAKAQEPKIIKIFPDAGHLELRKNGREDYEKIIADFFDSIR